MNNLFSNYLFTYYTLFFFTDILNSISAWHSTYMCFILKPTLHLILAAKCLKMEWNILLSGILTLMHLYLCNNQLWWFKSQRNLSWNWLCIKIRLLLQKWFHTYVIWGSVHFFLIFPVYKKNLSWRHWSWQQVSIGHFFSNSFCLTIHDFSVNNTRRKDWLP